MLRFENGTIKTPDGEDFLKFLTEWGVQTSHSDIPLLVGKAIGWPSNVVDAAMSLDDQWGARGMRYLVVESHDRVIIPTSGINIASFSTAIRISSRSHSSMRSDGSPFSMPGKLYYEVEFEAPLPWNSGPVSDMRGRGTRMSAEAEVADRMAALRKIVEAMQSQEMEFPVEHGVTDWG